MRIKTLLLAALVSAGSANAAELITNGGFETGDYTGWSANVQSGSSGGLSIVGNGNGNSPVSGSSYLLNAVGGEFFSITDQNGPGSYSLTQSFTLATAQSVKISFQMFANNQAGVTYTNGRDYTGGVNQNAVVDLLIGGADPFTNAAGDIVSVLYGPGSDSFNNPNPWSSYSTTLSLAAGTYTLRFAETDNQLFFQQGVDNVSVLTTVPEPATWALMIGGFGAVGVASRRSRRAVAA